MLFNTMSREQKKGMKWEQGIFVTDPVIVHDSLASDLYFNLVKNRKMVKKIVCSGQTLIVYYDKRTRAVYNVNYGIVQDMKPVNR